MSRKLPQIIVISGPTACGKSDLALKLAKKFNGEIVSADSRQIYKEMDIGTAKTYLGQNYQKTAPGKYTISDVPHHLLDIVKPNQKFTLAQFKKQAVKIIEGILKRGKIPFLVGGTGLYVSAITDNLSIPPATPDKKMRGKIESEIKDKGLDHVWKKLLRLDPAAAEIVDQRNPRRVIRALEVCLTTGRPFSAQRMKGQPLFDVLQIGISVPREKLYAKINRRSDKMMEAGLLTEVKKLAKKYSWELPSMSGIGYRQFRPYLEKQAGLPEAVEALKRDTRHYAKKQLTWFRRDERIRWVKNRQEAEILVKKFLRSAD